MSQLNALLKNEAMMKRQRVVLTRSQKKEICLLLSKIRNLKSDLLAYQILKKKQTSIDSYIGTEVSIVIVI